MTITKADKPGEYTACIESAELNVILNMLRRADSGFCGVPDCPGCKYVRNILDEFERIACVIDEDQDERLILLTKFVTLGVNLHQ